MNNGWIKLHRELLDKCIWQDSTPEQKTILITIILMANHEEKQWLWKGQKYEAKPGQLVTSAQSIAARCGKGISRQNIRTALDKFEKHEFLTKVSTKTGMLITITNWGLYQLRYQDPYNKITKNQPTVNQELTTNNNDNIDKNSITTLSKVESEYKCIYEYYLSLNLIKHTKYKPEMADAMKRAMIELNCDVDQLKVLLRRHSEKVNATKNTQYPVKIRSLSEFFGQKKYGSTTLICADYDDDVYMQYMTCNETRGPLGLPEVSIDQLHSNLGLRKES